MALFTALFLIALVAAAVLLQPSPPEAPEPFLDADKLPTADQGKPIPVVFGTVIVESPNVVWYGDLGYRPVKSGGK